MSAQGAPTIRADTTIDALLDHFPRAAAVFVRRRMHCVGCPLARFETVGDACAIYRQPVDAMLGDLRRAAAGG
ncbi:MAG TPA: DUF1858 domain-containing protein [Thermomicrobiaceae bacterium]|nr:DUF1858 domain-containing protein [Thermomicrobiaceae bacterium]